MKFIFASVLFLSSMAAHADCGLSGSLTERIASCGRSTEGLNLVMQKGLRFFWFDSSAKAVYQTVSTTPWAVARKSCRELSGDLKLDGVKRDWDLAGVKELTASIVRVYPQLRKTSSDFDEKRFWLRNSFNHPSGQLWAYFYSTNGYISDWFADAGDSYYVGGICNVILN